MMVMIVYNQPERAQITQQTTSRCVKPEVLASVGLIQNTSNPFKRSNFGPNVKDQRAEIVIDILFE